MSPIGGKNNTPPRFWDHAIEKRDREGKCRNPRCLRGFARVEFCHLSGRTYDQLCECPAPDCDRGISASGSKCAVCKGTGQVLYVRPESGIPLCGPATDTASCHARQEAGTLDLIPHITNEEAACAVLDLGLHRAYRDLSGGRR